MSLSQNILFQLNLFVTETANVNESDKIEKNADVDEKSQGLIKKEGSFIVSNVI